MLNFRKIIYYCISISAILFVACDGPFQPFIDSVGKELNPINAGDTYIYEVYSEHSATYAGISRVEWTYLPDTIINNVKMYPQARYAYDLFGNFAWYLLTYHAQDDFGFYNYQSNPNDQYPMP
ncbi:MAG: hypothetical protein N2748_00310, partial [candidate division WOR-3 bacterium]|nr:hypothetical protein [candidate division WOR-3 bacterium]